MPRDRSTLLDYFPRVARNDEKEAAAAGHRRSPSSASPDSGTGTGTRRRCESDGSDVDEPAAPSPAPSAPSPASDNEESRIKLMSNGIFKPVSKRFGGVGPKVARDRVKQMQIKLGALQVAQRAGLSTPESEKEIIKLSKELGKKKKLKKH